MNCVREGGIFGGGERVDWIGGREIYNVYKEREADERRDSDLCGRYREQ